MPPATAHRPPQTTTDEDTTMGSPRTNASRPLALLAAGLAASSAADARNVATVNATQIFGTVDPAKVNDYTEYMAGVNLYDGLTTLDGDGAIVPLLAESWEVSDDALTWTFTLKEDAVFQDGSPVEAKDVAWSVDRLLSINQGPANLFEGVLKPGSTTAPDARTVRFQLDKVYTPFLTTTPILFVVNSDLATERGGDDEWAQGWIGDNSAGAGPFRSRELGAGRVDGAREARRLPPRLGRELDRRGPLRRHERGGDRQGARRVRRAHDVLGLPGARDLRGDRAHGRLPHPFVFRPRRTST